MRRSDWGRVLALAQRHALGWLESLDTRPIYPRAGSAVLLARLDRPVPEEPTPPTEVIEALVRDVEAGLTAMPSGRFFGWVIGGGLPAALAADWLTSAWDQNTGSAEGTPAAAAVEQVAIRWVLELLDLPRSASAALVTGAQMANTVCLAAARHRVLAAVGWDVEADGLLGAPPVTVVVGEERHSAIPRSARFLGLGEARLRVVPADGQGRMRAEALGEAVASVDGPLIVCAQVGNVNTGSIDPIPAIVDVLAGARERLPAGAVWLHLDGAFGLWARASARLGELVASAERADSWATDGHKWPNTPYDCGIALVADREAHRRAMANRAEYLPEAVDDAIRAPLDWTPELSRRARGFALYAALAELGRRGVAELVERTCELARRFAGGLAAIPGVEVLNEVVLNQVLVAFGDDGRTREVVRAVRDDGTCFVSGTVWRGRAAMRISLSNAFTDEDDVDRSVAAMRRAFEAGRAS